MGRKLPEKILSDDEEKRILNQFNKRYPTGLRNYCMFKMMMYLGLRVSEVINLEKEHVDMMTYRIFIKESKGAKDRVIWGNKELIEDIQQWIKTRDNLIDIGKIPHPEDIQRNNGVKESKIKNYLFITHNGTPVKASYMRKKAKEVSKDANIPDWKKVHPHAFRHSYATKYYERWKDIQGLADNLGHASTNTTQIYVQVAEGDRKNRNIDFLDEKNTDEGSISDEE